MPLARCVGGGKGGRGSIWIICPFVTLTFMLKVASDWCAAWSYCFANMFTYVVMVIFAIENYD